MGLEHKDRVADTTSTSGTGTITLLGGVPTGVVGHRTFSASGFTTGALVNYSIESADGTQWEVGQGTWTASGNTLTRTTVYASSSAGAALTLSGATYNVRCVPVGIEHDRIAGSILMPASKTTSATSGWQKVPLATVDFDTHGCWDATNLRFKPSKPGYYLVTGRVRTNTAALATCAVWKNATTSTGGGATATYILGQDTGSSEIAVAGTCLVYCNGTTDYLEFAVFANGTTIAYTAGADGFMQVAGPVA